MLSLSLSTSVSVDTLPHLSELSYLQDESLFLPHSRDVKVQVRWGAVIGNGEVASTQ